MKKLSFFVVSMMMLAAPAWAQSNTGKVLSAQPKLTVDQLVQQGIDVNDVTHLADANTVEGLFSPEKKTRQARVWRGRRAQQHQEDASGR